MPNVVCYTQNVPGEREWINSNFPGYTNLGIEADGAWLTEPKKGNFIWEVPYTYPQNSKFINSLNGLSFKTVYQNDLDTIIHDNNILDSDDMLVNSKIIFSNIKREDIKNYMMFTFCRCGSVFTESLLRKKYPPIREIHYPFVGTDKIDVIKTYCADPTTRICLNYRSNWWSWITSHALVKTNAHMNERGVLHYFDQVDWNNINSASLTDAFFDEYEHYIINTFNFWIQLRLILPTHQFSLFRFEDILPVYQTQTDHKQVPYNKVKLIKDYEQTEQHFKEKYLPRWQSIETKALNFLAKLNVTPTTSI